MQKITKEHLIADYKRVAHQLDKRPTLKEYNQHGRHSSTPIYKQFESFEALKDAAGYRTGEKKIPDDDLLNDLQRVAEKIGRTPPIEAYREHGKYNPKTLKRRIGSWHDVLQNAGLEPTEWAEHFKDSDGEQFGKRYGNAEVECAYCGNVKLVRESRLEYKDRFFCGHDCRGQFMSEQTGEDARAWEGGKVEVACETCGSTTKVRPAKASKTRFCSQDCMLEWRSKHLSGENHPRWKDGYERYYGPNWRRQRRKARERDGYQCQSCGLDRAGHHDAYGCEPPAHHIVRFGDFDSYKKANRLKNLITLCRQCHGLVDHGPKELSEEMLP